MGTKSRIKKLRKNRLDRTYKWIIENIMTIQRMKLKPEDLYVKGYYKAFQDIKLFIEGKIDENGKSTNYGKKQISQQPKEK